MSSEMRLCKTCNSQFPIEPEDLAFYEKFGVSKPLMCPPCRAKRRLAFKNERTFYKRACDKCGKDVVSMYSPNKSYTVWCYECWFADDWDPLEFGKAYDRGRPFIRQFKALWEATPKVALIYVRSVNSEYVNISADNKNCYMLVESSNNEDCTHCYWIQQCRDLTDVSFSHQTERSYECDDCFNCYGLRYSKGCHDCRESYFLFDSVGCTDCLGCANLRGKKHHIFNEPYSKEVYEKKLKEFRLETHSGVEAFRKKFQEFLENQPRKFAQILNAPGCTGNYIKNAKNCTSCFHCYDAEDCRYNVHVWRQARDCMDNDTAGRSAEMIYNSINAGIDTSNYIATAQCWSSSFMRYSYNCMNSNYCFGCVGLRKKDYCVLNRRYGKEEYEKITGEIVKSLKDTGEYGEFFPSDISTFGYNESAAQEQFPLTKEEAVLQGFKWEDAPRGTYGKETLAWDSVPDSIRDLESADIAKEIFACVKCRKNYRIIPNELAFYKKMDIPLPRLCPDCRHSRRFNERGPNRTWHRKCQCVGSSTLDVGGGHENKMPSSVFPAGQSGRQFQTSSSAYRNIAEHTHGLSPCPNEFETSYSPGRPELVYCEQCYRAEIA